MYSGKCDEMRCLERRRAILNRAVLVAAVSLIGLFSTVAGAEAYPDGPVTMVVPYAPGGTADLLARTFAEHLTKSLGQKVIVSIKAGAGSMIGAEYVARGKPDGYTILLGANPLTINAAVMNLTFDPIKELVPVAGVVGFPSVLVTSAHSSYRNIADIVSASKREHLTFGSSGPGTVSQMCGELLKSGANFEMAHVPYKGSGAVYPDLIAGRVSLLCDVSGSAVGFIKNGSVRALAVTSKDRLKALPNVPTVAEQGFPGFEVLSWFGIFVPLGTPPEVVARLEKAVGEVVRTQDFVARVDQLGGFPLSEQSTADFGRFYRAEADHFKSLVRDGKLQRLGN